MRKHWLIIPCAVLLATSCATNTPIRVVYQLGTPIKYPGDLDSIPAIPKCIVIRCAESEYLKALRDMGFQDLTSYLEKYDLILHTDSITVRSINLSPKGDSIWVQIENAFPNGGFADLPKKDSLLHLILLEKTHLPIMMVEMWPMEE